MMGAMTWQGIGFDLDNTLFSHEKAFQTAIEDSYLLYCKSQGLLNTHIPFERFFPEFKRNSDKYWQLFEEKKVDGPSYRRLRFNETMKTLDLPFGDDLSDQFHHHYYQVVDEYSVPFKGLHELMILLKDHDVRLVIVTNGTVDTQYGKVKRLGLDRWIRRENVIVSEEVGVAKPEQAIFRIAEKKLDLPADKLLFVGDSWKHDIVGAIDAGWDAIFLNTRAEERITDHTPLNEYSSLEELYHYLSQTYGRGSTK